MKKSTCYQPQNPNCIDYLLTNQKTFKHCETFETGIWDHHKVIPTIIKSGIFNEPPKRKIYRSYKRFVNKCFSNALRKEFEALKGEFEKKFAVLNTCVSIKTKIITFNDNVFITKELRKEIMKRSKLRNKFNRNIIHEKLV